VSAFNAMSLAAMTGNHVFLFFTVRCVVLSILYELLQRNIHSFIHSYSFNWKSCQNVT